MEMPHTTFNTNTPPAVQSPGPVAPPLPPMGNNNAAPVAPPPPQMGMNHNAGAPVAPPPPPMMNGGGQPPAPPPPPTMAMGGGAPAPAINESTGDAGRDALLASIRGAGGIGALKKVDKSQLDKPSVLLQEARGEPAAPTMGGAPPPGGAGPSAGGQGSLADALAAALNKRKNRVGAHDDDDAGDDW